MNNCGRNEQKLDKNVSDCYCNQNLTKDKHTKKNVVININVGITNKTKNQNKNPNKNGMRKIIMEWQLNISLSLKNNKLKKYLKKTLNRL